MNANAQINIKAPASQLWRILAEEYDQISEWAAVVLESEPNPDVAKGEGRLCVTTIGNNKETITHIDEQARTFTYAVVPEKSPFFLRGLENSWMIEPTSDNESIVSMRATVKLLPVFSQLVGPSMKRRMEKGFVKILEELKYYAETGQVHPRKQKQLAA